MNKVELILDKKKVFIIGHLTFDNVEKTIIFLKI